MIYLTPNYVMCKMILSDSPLRVIQNSHFVLRDFFPPLFWVIFAQKNLVLGVDVDVKVII